MNDRKFAVKPAKPRMGLRDPQTKRPVPDDGALVPDTAFWRRRVKNGDVKELTDSEWASVEKARAKKALAAHDPKANANSKGK